MFINVYEGVCNLENDYKPVCLFTYLEQIHVNFFIVCIVTPRLRVNQAAKAFPCPSLLTLRMVQELRFVTGALWVLLENNVNEELIRNKLPLKIFN